MEAPIKWFKHFSDSLDDPFIQELMDRFSHFGYVAYFGLLEIIAKENGTKLTGKLNISPTYLKRKLRSTPAKLRQVFDVCQTFGKLTATYSEKEWLFYVPKLLILKDNYMKDLQVTGKKPSNHKEVEVEVYKKEVEEEKKKITTKEKIYKKERFQKPTVHDIGQYCQERKNNINPEKFFDFYESKGWMVGKNKMKNWKSAIRTWENNQIDGKRNFSVSKATFYCEDCSAEHLVNEAPEACKKKRRLKMKIIEDKRRARRESGNVDLISAKEILKTAGITLDKQKGEE